MTPKFANVLLAGIISHDNIHLLTTSSDFVAFFNFTGLIKVMLFSFLLQCGY